MPGVGRTPPKSPSEMGCTLLPRGGGSLFRGPLAGRTGFWSLLSSAHWHVSFQLLWPLVQDTRQKENAGTSAASLAESRGPRGVWLPSTSPRALMFPDVTYRASAALGRAGGKHMAHPPGGTSREGSLAGLPSLPQTDHRQSEVPGSPAPGSARGPAPAGAAWGACGPHTTLTGSSEHLVRSARDGRRRPELAVGKGQRRASTEAAGLIQEKGGAGSTLRSCGRGQKPGDPKEGLPSTSNEAGEETSSLLLAKHRAILLAENET